MGKGGVGNFFFFFDTKAQRDKAKPKLGSIEETSKSTFQKNFWRYLSLSSKYTKRTVFWIFQKNSHYNPMGPGKSIFYS